MAACAQPRLESVIFDATVRISFWASDVSSPSLATIDLLYGKGILEPLRPSRAYHLGTGGARGVPNFEPIPCGRLELT